MKIQRGFSLIEIVVTIAIMGILMAAAMPGMGDWLRNMKVRNAAESIQNGLQQARSAAVSRNRPVSLYLVSDLTSSCTLSASSGSWVVSVNSPVGKCNLDTSLSDATQIAAKGAVQDGGSASVAATRADKSTAATTVTFSGLGMLSQATVANAARNITVASSDGLYTRRVEITAAGVSRVCDPMITADGDARKCLQ